MLLSTLHQEDTVDAALILRVVGHLGVATPDNLSTSGDETEFADVDLDDGTLGQNTQLGVERVLGVLLDTDDGQLNGNAKLGVCDVGLLVTETHGSDEALVLGVASSKVGSDKGGLSDHALPGLLLDLLSGLDDGEHLLLADTTDLGQRDGELGRLLGSLVLDGAAESLGSRGVCTVQKVRGHGRRGILLVRGLDVALLVRLNGLLHLDLLLVSLLLVQLSPETAQVLSILRGLVALTGGTLANSLFMIETAAVQLTPSFHILVLRL